jgi:hypothetical protein
MLCICAACGTVQAGPSVASEGMYPCCSVSGVPETRATGPRRATRACRSASPSCLITGGLKPYLTQITSMSTSVRYIQKIHRFVVLNLACCSRVYSELSEFLHMHGLMHAVGRASSSYTRIVVFWQTRRSSYTRVSLPDWSHIISRSTSIRSHPKISQNCSLNLACCSWFS